MPHQPQQLDGARPRRAWPQLAVAHERLADLVADREAGLSEVIGSWKIMASRLPRRSRICAPAGRRGRGPRSSTQPDMRAPALAGGRMIDERGDALAAARLADDAQGAARHQREADAVTATVSRPRSPSNTTRRSETASSGAGLTRSPPRWSGRRAPRARRGPSAPSAGRGPAGAPVVHPALPGYPVEAHQLGSGSAWSSTRRS